MAGLSVSNLRNDVTSPSTNRPSDQGRGDAQLLLCGARASSAGAGDRIHRKRPVDGRGRIGYPVVVKPLDGNHGRGVSIDLTTRRAGAGGVREGARARLVARVIVETFLEGHDYRILVVDGKVVAVAQRVPGHVVGDGEHTVAELVEIVNTRSRAAASATRRCSPGWRSTTRPSACSTQAGLTLETRAPRRARSSTCARPATSRPAARPST